jgi:hypothetical protein
MELNRELPDAFFSWKLLGASVALAIVLFPSLERVIDRWMPAPLEARPPAAGADTQWDLRSHWH